MALYVCPHCGRNDKIAELAVCWVAFIGEFNSEGEVIATSHTVEDGLDSYDSRYRCCSCDYEFERWDFAVVADDPSTCPVCNHQLESAERYCHTCEVEIKICNKL